MKIGYSSLTVGVFDAMYKNCILKNATDENLLKIINHNINTLDRVIDYNISNGIKLFRISSNIIPFGSSEVNKVKWWDVFSHQLYNIGLKAKKNGMRLSMHPGQYTVLNSLSKEIVSRAIKDLEYHNQFLDSLGLDSKNKLILHIGGVYNDKKESMQRFIDNFELLDDKIKSRLVIENDDKSYNIYEVLEIGRSLGIPVVYDNLHNAINYYDQKTSDQYWIEECRSTWKKEDGHQKVHYSEQDYSKQIGSHSKTININSFLRYFVEVVRDDLDIMLEVKDKNISAIKCLNTVFNNENNLLKEWNLYKYKILEYSPNRFKEINDLINDFVEDYQNDLNYFISFYNLIDDALSDTLNHKKSLEAALHIWKDICRNVDEKEENKFLALVKKYQKNEITIKYIKTYLYKLINKYEIENLKNVYYFI